MNIGILGDETFLFTSNSSLKKLSSLSLRSCNDLDFQTVDRGSKNEILTKIIEDHASLLQTLEIKGNFKIK